MSYAQVEALYALFTELMSLGNKGVSFGTMEARLCYLLLHGIYEKLHRMIVPVGGKRKKKYMLTLSEVESLSFYLFFQMYSIPPHHAFADVTINAISQHIDQQFI